MCRIPPKKLIGVTPTSDKKCHYALTFLCHKSGEFWDIEWTGWAGVCSQDMGRTFGKLQFNTVVVSFEPGKFSGDNLRQINPAARVSYNEMRCKSAHMNAVHWENCVPMMAKSTE